MLRSFLILAAALLLSGPGQTQPAPPPAPSSAASAAAAQPVSAAARRLYERARGQLLQIRTLLRSQDSQASVGSGFLVSEQGHVITNYHVVSQAALEPESYRLRYATTDGRGGELELLDFDVRRDLALLRVKGEGLKGAGALQFRPLDQPLSKGDRIYSMGNPHDVAFAVVEGTYNGLVERSFDPLIYYSGSINSGMSGGPVVDEEGRVVGINVSAMFFAQQMSFLVPAEFAGALFQRSRAAKPLAGPAWPRLREQLLAYQEALTSAFVAQPWRSAGQGRYRLPVPQEDFMRCWGRGTPADSKGLEFQRSQCRMEHAVFISGNLQTGYLDISHEAYDGRNLGALRFAKQFSGSFRNENLGRANKQRTAPYCREEFIQGEAKDGPPLRAVICLTAYRKLRGLHDLSVLVTTVDAATEGALGRFDARGVSFDNALRLSAHYLGGFGWTAARPQ
ncbi:MAG TPA: serine protease [Roseateles sp.]|nr:serine protease [Roseateles sp.]